MRNRFFAKIAAALLSVAVLAALVLLSASQAGLLSTSGGGTKSAATGAKSSADDWPQVQNNPQRTGYSSEALGTNFKVAWTHPFQPERVYPQVQAIVYRGTVFVGTESGRVYGLDAKTGEQRWVFAAGGPILSSVAATGGRVFFGAMDGAVYALDAFTGTQVWQQQLSQRLGFSVSPVIADGKVMLGGRDGRFYAVNLGNGGLLWSYDAGSPILQTAAADNGKVFFGAMDMRVYALNTSRGSLEWKSDPVAGTAFKDYWPVVYQGKVIVSPMANRADPGIAPGFPFGWQSNLSWISQYGPTVAAGNLTRIPDAMKAQDDAIARYQANPSGFASNLDILDEATGKVAMVVPNFSSQTMNGATTPPCVDRDGKLIVPVLFIRSGWGRLDLGKQRITDVLYDGTDWRGQPFGAGNQYPAGMGNVDENLNVSCAGNFVLAFHTEEGNANYTGAFDLDTRRWTQIGRGWTSGQMSSNTQGGGGNPASVAGGMLYHISTDELIARTAR